MTITITPKTDNTINSTLLEGGIQRTLDLTGRLPPVSLVVTPIDGNESVHLDRFLSYQFSSSILIPVDTFSFNFSSPDADPLYKHVKDGDIITLFGNDVPLSTGIIDAVDTETDEQFGEKNEIPGRDLMSQLEDQDAISIQDTPIWGNSVPIGQVITSLITNTRVKGFRLQSAPSGSYLFATEPGESKLAALQRYLEPLNCLAWMDPNGTMVVGRPNMSQSPVGTFFVQRSARRSNCTSIKVIRSATSIANIIVPIWSGQENVTDRVPIGQRVYNAAQGPKRLRLNGHRVPKTVVVSTPQANSPQGLSDINLFKAASGNLLQAHAKREIARANQKELIAQVVVPGHYNESGQPYRIDTVYRVQYDRAILDENMYLFQVEYSADENGQRTSLYFCRLGTIVSDVRAP